MYAWPLIAKNKVEDSQITIPVKVYMESEDEGVRVWAEKVYSAHVVCTFDIHT